MLDFFGTFDTKTIKAQFLFLCCEIRRGGCTCFQVLKKHKKCDVRLY